MTELLLVVLAALLGLLIGMVVVVCIWIGKILARIDGMGTASTPDEQRRALPNAITKKMPPTDEMIDAGFAVILYAVETDPHVHADRRLVEEIYRAMCSATPRATALSSEEELPSIECWQSWWIASRDDRHE